VLKATASVILSNFKASDIYCIETGYFTIMQTATRVSWFISTNRTTSQNSAGFNFATLASLGSGELNLCGESLVCEHPVDITSTFGSGSLRWRIHNGTLGYEGSSTLIFLDNVDFADIIFENMNFASSTNSSFFGVYNTSTCRDVKFINFSSFQSGTASRILNVGSGCSVSGAFSIQNSSIKSGTIVANGGTIDSAYWSNNTFTIYDSFNLNGTKPIISNNYFNSAITAGCVMVIQCVWAAQIANNLFNAVSLYVNSYASVIDAVITGNTFGSNNNYLSKLVFIGVESDTAFKGCVVTGNAFTGTYGTLSKGIECSGTFSNAWIYVDYLGTRFAYSSIHTCNISGNSTNEKNIRVPTTKGYINYNSVTSTVETISGGFRYVCTIDNNIMFYIPGSTVSVSTTPVALVGLGNGSVQNDINNTRPLGGSYGQYNADGKYYFFAKDTQMNGAIIGFEMYNIQECAFLP
jgi:hypothetical protein